MASIESKRSYPRLYGIADFSGKNIEMPVAEEDDYPFLPRSGGRYPQTGWAGDQ
jgi:hypothetical protein